MTFLGYVVRESPTNSWPFEKHSPVRSRPILPVNDCPCDLFAVTWKHIRICNWILENPTGKRWLPVWQGILDRTNVFCLSFSLAMVRYRTRSEIFSTIYIDPFKFPSGLFMFWAKWKWKPSWALSYEPIMIPMVMNLEPWQDISKWFRLHL